MKISQQMVEMLSKQVNAEYYAAYLYKSMGNWAKDENWDGLASWMDEQAAEEMEHAQRLHKYIQERGGKTIFATVDAPQASWGSPLEAMRGAYEHELKVTESFYRMTEEATAAKDYMTVSALQWFLDEQVEEEDQTSGWVALYERAGDNLAALMAIDRGLSKREG